jgi:predicted amidohydrolase
MHWQSLLVARAIENQAYVAGCNRVGTDGNGTITGAIVG